MQAVPPPSRSSAPEGSPAWRYLRWSRLAAVAATLVYLAGTHYPRLVIGEPGDGPDKLLHLTAFATLTTLFRISGIASTIPRAVAAMAFLAVFDEATQELPGLGRSFDLLDLVADGLGIALAAAWLKALGPPSSRDFVAGERYERRIAGLRLLLSRFINWCHLAVASVLGVLVGGTTLAVVGRNPVIGPTTMLVVGAIVGAVAALVAAVEAGRRQMDRRLGRDRRCLACLEPVPSTSDRCACGGRPAAPSTDGSLRSDLPSVATGTGMLRSAIRRHPVLYPTVSIVVAVAILGVALDLVHVFTDFRFGGPGRGVVRWFGDLPVADAMALDAAILGIIAAGSVAVLRRRGDRRLSEGRSTCPTCGYDLRHLPPGSGDSICPECGAPAAPAIADQRGSGDDGGRC